MALISGILKSGAGVPMANAVVTVTPVVQIVGYTGGAIVQTDLKYVTNGSGLLTMTLQPGAYTLRAFVYANDQTTLVEMRTASIGVTGADTMSLQEALGTDPGDITSTVGQSAIAAADLARAWAESPTPPDPDDPDSKSAKSWAGQIAFLAETLPSGPVVTRALAIEGQTDFAVTTYPALATDAVSVFVNGAFVAPVTGWVVPPELIDGDTCDVVRLTEAVPAGTEVVVQVLPLTRTELPAVDWGNITGKPATAPDIYTTFNVLAFADPQPEETGVANWRAVMNAIAGDARPAVEYWLAGDIVDHGGPDGRTTFSDPYTFSDAWADYASIWGVTPASLIATFGNHDNGYGPRTAHEGAYRFDEARKWFGPGNFARRRGNLLHIGLSPIGRSTTGHYPKPLIAWAKRLIAENQNCNIALQIHHPLAGMYGLAGTGPLNAVVANSNDFDWLNTAGHRVDVYLSGHQGNNWVNDAGEVEGDPDPTDLQPGFFIDASRGNLRCVNLNLPPDKAGSPARPKSVCYLRFVDGSTAMEIERVNVPAMTTRETYSVPLRNASRITGDVQSDSRFSGDEIIGPAREHWIEWPRYLDGDNLWQPKTGPQVVARYGATDAGGDNVSAGDGVSIALAVPGLPPGSALNVNPPPPLSELGYDGVHLSAVRRFGSDTDRRAAFRVSVNGDAGIAPVADFTDAAMIAKTHQFAFVLGDPFTGEEIPPAVTFRASDGGPQLIRVRGRAGASSVGWSSADTVLAVANHGVTGRSINAGGTINAAGADYAEYFRLCDRMISAGETLARGDVAGLDCTGNLTTCWADVVSGFLIKSTAPNLVGNGAWSTEAAICEKYGLPLAGDQPEEHAPEYPEWAARQAAIDAAYQAERPLWDRMALCGQVPLSITATPADVGKYAVPQDQSGAIGVAFVPENQLTLDLWRIALGRVISINSAGQPVILVGGK